MACDRPGTGRGAAPGDPTTGAMTVSLAGPRRAYGNVDGGRTVEPGVSRCCPQIFPV